MPLTAALALFAFAANSLLCRLALRSGEADPVTFTVIRLATGAAMLWGLGRVRGWRRQRSSWAPAAWLALYAFGFSWAYIRLDAGVGALLLFGCVQLTMLLAAVRGREAMPPAFWLGTALAASGVGWLVRPGGAAPAWDGVLTMALAGVAWGRYSLAGRGSADPAAGTRDNFVRATMIGVPVAAIAAGAWWATAAGVPWAIGPAVLRPALTPRGLLLAATSGAVTSGLGYVLWYAALRTMSASRAAALQLSVPVLTALLAVPLLREAPTPRLGIAAVLVLGGIGLTLQRPRLNAGPR